MKCYQLLNLSVTSFVDDISMIPRLPKDKPYGSCVINPKLFLKADVYNKISQLGNLTGLIFEMGPKTEKNSIHVDIISSTKELAWSGLNLIFEGQGSMQWFNPKREGIVIEHPSHKYLYKAWFKDYGNPIDIWDKGKVALVRTDIPHQVWNYDDSNRFVASIRWDKRTTWEETINWFNSNFPGV